MGIRCASPNVRRAQRQQDRSFRSLAVDKRRSSPSPAAQNASASAIWTPRLRGTAGTASTKSVRAAVARLRILDRAWRQASSRRRQMKVARRRASSRRCSQYAEAAAFASGRFILIFDAWAPSTRTGGFGSSLGSRRACRRAVGTALLPCLRSCCKSCGTFRAVRRRRRR